jgi:signal peptidase II
MIALSLTMLVVLVSDQALKLLLRRARGFDALPLGPFGSVRMVGGQLWVRRLGGPASGVTMWTFWAAAAAALVIVGSSTPSSRVFQGLLLGGSLSNALESTLRGTVSDYVCLRFWPPFNLADLALTIGAIGILAELLIALPWNGVVK